MEKPTVFIALLILSFLSETFTCAAEGGLTLDVVCNNEGRAFSKINVGTPPVEITALVDPGSAINWVQCPPCLNGPCPSMDRVLFNTSASSTFNVLPCSSPYLGTAYKMKCDDTNTTLLLDIGYNLDGYSNGVMATDNFMVDSVSFPNIAFGCANNYSKDFALMGLNYNHMSLVSQMGFNIFSHCVPPMETNATGKLRFDNHTTFSSGTIVSTIPYLINQTSKNYWVILEGVSIGEDRVNVPFNHSRLVGNVAFDLGTPATYLPPVVYEKLESFVKSHIKFDPAPVPAKNFQLCYNNTFEFDAPSVTFHFDGVDMKTSNKFNIFAKVSEDLQCFTIAPKNTTNPTFLIGSYAQLNFQFEYDLQGNKISFAETDCTKV